MPRFARRFETKFLFQRIQKVGRRAFIDSDRAITLHIGMATNRAQPRAWLSNIAAQQHEIGDFADHNHRMTMLRDTHRPGADNAASLHVNVSGMFQRLTQKPRLVLNFVP